ncbi:MAG: hypothetical protein AB9873_17815 [Syntrophobacteraceae bacterium]
MEEPAYTCKKTMAVVYNLRIKEPSPKGSPGWTTWADITIREWFGQYSGGPRNGGSIQIISDYGNYGFAWSHIGDKCLRQFLLALEADYFFGKVVEGGRRNYEVIDMKATLEDIRKEIVSMRREGRIDKEQARDFWEQIEEGSDVSRCISDEELYRALDDHDDLFRIIFHNDFENVPVSHTMNGQCRGFWDRIWPAACDVWRKELAELAAAESMTVPVPQTEVSHA